jgi:hypothetical protein
MIDVLAVVIIVLALAAAGWSLLTAALNRLVGVTHLVALGVLEVALLVQAVIAIVDLVGGARPAEPAVFVAYLVGVLAIPPVGAYIGLGERSRWGGVAVAVACLAVPVMLVRLQQLWLPANA